MPKSAVQQGYHCPEHITSTLTVAITYKMLLCASTYQITTKSHLHGVRTFLQSKMSAIVGIDESGSGAVEKIDSMEQCSTITIYHGVLWTNLPLLLCLLLHLWPYELLPSVSMLFLLRVTKRHPHLGVLMLLICNRRSTSQDPSRWEAWTGY